MPLLDYIRVLCNNRNIKFNIHSTTTNSTNIYIIIIIINNNIINAPPNNNNTKNKRRIEEERRKQQQQRTTLLLINDLHFLSQTSSTTVAWANNGHGCKRAGHDVDARAKATDASFAHSPHVSDSGLG